MTAFLFVCMDNWLRIILCKNVAKILYSLNWFAYKHAIVQFKERNKTRKETHSQCSGNSIDKILTSPCLQCGRCTSSLRKQGTCLHACVGHQALSNSAGDAAARECHGFGGQPGRFLWSPILNSLDNDMDLIHLDPRQVTFHPFRKSPVRLKAASLNELQKYWQWIYINMNQPSSSSTQLQPWPWHRKISCMMCPQPSNFSGAPSFFSFTLWVLATSSGSPGALPFSQVNHMVNPTEGGTFYAKWHEAQIFSIFPVGTSCWNCWICSGSCECHLAHLEVLGLEEAQVGRHHIACAQDHLGAQRYRTLWWNMVK